MFWFRSSSSASVEEPTGQLPPLSPSPYPPPSPLTPSISESSPTFGSSFLRITLEPIPSGTNTWLVFTCLNSRAIHLELTPAGDSSALVEAFNRFTRMWAIPEEVTFFKRHSFESEEFTPTRNRLGNILPMLQAINKFKLVLHCQTPLWNRFYSIFISTLGFALKTFVSTQPIDASTVKKIEELINSRPLLKNGNGWHLISPEHLVNGAPFESFKPVTLVTSNELIQFWSKWSLKYLWGLKEYHEMALYFPEPGEVVLLWAYTSPKSSQAPEPKSTPIGQFTIAVIEEIIGNVDGLPVRATIALPSGESHNEELKNLIPLECATSLELLNNVLLPLQTQID